MTISRDCISVRGINNDKKIYQQCNDDKRFQAKNFNLKFQRYFGCPDGPYLGEVFMLKNSAGDSRKPHFNLYL